ncbi:MAG: prepilin-type N-terminal cleavage/methylation domain-containing protein [Leptolyngbyaceae bacterium]|nr:prepilin-type N-terminal cleavage/methylation domain-containing protein [Leptolyngbyaceae bacterium]
MSKLLVMAMHLTHQGKAVESSSMVPAPHKRDKGLTLMECIVAIAVIALTGAMIGPPLVLAAATRLQNRRVEQSTQIAQGEIDRIRTLVTLSDHSRDNIPAATLQTNLDDEVAPAASFNLLKSVNAGCANPYDESDDGPVPINQALPIDIDGDCEEDFLVQTFRDEGSFSSQEDARGNNGRPNNFNVMVRVYAANAAENYGSLGTEPASLRFTSGEGNQRQRPLAVLTSEMSWSDTDGSLFCYHSTNNDCEE